jgi:ferredoxin-NADP reductase
VRVGRLNPVVLAAPGWTREAAPAVFICGPTGFVEAAASLLVKAGHDASVIKTERFGPSGGQP